MSHKYNPPHDPELEWASVTTICKDSTNSSGPLMQWAANMVVEWIRQNCPTRVIDEQEGPFYSAFEDELNKARFNYKDVSQEALDVGSAVHDAIEQYLKTGKEPKIENDQVLAGFVAFLEFKDEHKLKPIALEQVVYGEWFGGRVDYYGMFDGKKYVIDWKSSRAIYPEMRYQTAAYRSCFAEAEGNGILRLDKETGQPEFYDASKSYERDLEIFYTMVKLYYLRHPRLAKKAGVQWWKGE
jgi:hypothetical protein